MTEHDQICAEKYIERVGMCMDSGMTLTHADAVAVAEVGDDIDDSRMGNDVDSGGMGRDEDDEGICGWRW